VQTDRIAVWTSAGPNGPNFNANIAGQYRMTINYSGGCFNRYYFNVYKTRLILPQLKRIFIVLLRINNRWQRSGYEYSLDKINYVSTNIF
jgi:hypothetical protein